jgi:diphthine synthase
MTLKAMKGIQNCEHVYYESYTSPVLGHDVLEELSGAFGSSRVEKVKREFVEDGSKILEVAKNSSAALVCSGDPMVATTHQELRTRALRQGIQTRILHGSSVLCAVGGELGLHSYNFGRVVTMTREPMQYTAYETVFRNLLNGLHSTILLEWDESSNFFLEPKSAAKALAEAEKDLKQEIFNSETLLLVVSRLGSENQSISASRSLEELQRLELGAPPHVIVVPGKLHFTEREALGALLDREPSTFPDNSAKASRLSSRMVGKYSIKTMAALANARKAAANSDLRINFNDIFENVECYTQDAQRFLNEGKEELAVLSIGYAEGLLDSLRFGDQLEFEW